MGAILVGWQGKTADVVVEKVSSVFRVLSRYLEDETGRFLHKQPPLGGRRAVIDTFSAAACGKLKKEEAAAFPDR